MSYRQALRVQQSLNRVYRRTPTMAGGLAVRFYKDRWRFQAWHDDHREPWQLRKKKDKRGNRRRLLTKTGRLRRSIRVINKGRNHVLIGTDVPYAQVHNEGFSGSVKQSVSAHGVREHKRKSHSRGGRKIKRQTVSAHKRNGFSRTINQDIPARRFMARSKLLDRRIVMNIEHDLRKELRYLQNI